MQPLPRKILHSEVGTVIRPAETAGRCIATTGCGPAWDGCGLAWDGCGLTRSRCGPGVGRVRPRMWRGRHGGAAGAVLRCGSVWSCGAARCGPTARRGAILRCGRCGPAARLVRRLRRGSVWRLRCGGAVLRPVSLARSGAWRREAPSKTRQGRVRRPLRARRSGR